LKSVLRELENEERQHSRRIDELEREVGDAEYESERLKDKLAKSEKQIEEQKNEIATLKSQIAGAEIAKSDKNVALSMEVVALRFQLAEMRESLVRIERSGTYEQTRHFNDTESDDFELVLPDVFVSAAKRGLGGVVRSILAPEPNSQRRERLCSLLGSALMELCCQKEDALDTVKLLLSYGADVNAKKMESEGGRSALHAAAAKGNVSLLDLLLSVQDIDIDALDAQGRTPLHVASRLRKSEAVKMLLSKGADPAVQTMDRKTAEDLAKSSNNTSSFSLSFDSVQVDKVFTSPNIMFWNASALALRFYKKNEWLRAYDEFTRAVRVALELPSVTNSANLAKLYYNRSKVANLMGEVSQALDDCEEALALQPDYLNAIEVRSSCHMSLFDFGRAAADFSTLVSKAKDTMDRRKWEQCKKHAQRCNNASHYNVLGLKRKEASSISIKKAFRRESIRWHPDKHNRSREDSHRARIHFQRINEARQVLSCPSSKRTYDYSTVRSSGFYSDDDSESDFESDTEEYPWEKEDTAAPFFEKKESFLNKNKVEMATNIEMSAQLKEEPIDSEKYYADEMNEEVNQEPETKTDEEPDITPDEEQIAPKTQSSQAQVDLMNEQSENEEYQFEKSSCEEDSDEDDEASDDEIRRRLRSLFGVHMTEDISDNEDEDPNINNVELMAEMYKTLFSASFMADESYSEKDCLEGDISDESHEENLEDDESLRENEVKESGNPFGDIKQALNIDGHLFSAGIPSPTRRSNSRRKKKR